MRRQAAASRRVPRRKPPSSGCAGVLDFRLRYGGMGEIQGTKTETLVTFLGKQQDFRETNLLEQESDAQHERVLDVNPYEIKTLKLRRASLKATVLLLCGLPGLFPEPWLGTAPGALESRHSEPVGLGSAQVSPTGGVKPGFRSQESRPASADPRSPHCMPRVCYT